MQCKGTNIFLFMKAISEFFFRKFVLIDINQEIINFSFELNNFNIKILVISKIIIRAYLIYVK